MRLPRRWNCLLLAATVLVLMLTLSRLSHSSAEENNISNGISVPNRLFKSVKEYFATSNPDVRDERTPPELPSIITTSHHLDEEHIARKSNGLSASMSYTAEESNLKVLRLESKSDSRLKAKKNVINMTEIKSNLETIGLKSNHRIDEETRSHDKDTRKNDLSKLERKDNRSSSETRSDLITRAVNVSDQCERISQFGNLSKDMPRIMTNRNNCLAYCYIPKCGCTFWKRVMRFLNKDYKNKNIRSPFQIRRTETHSWTYSNPNTYIPFNVFNKIGHIYKRFMFVREPYSRLWSAYVDKFYLPDFWYDFHRKINDNRTPSSARPCPNDVTFQEFVSLSLITQEPHWDPMYQVCDPCRFKPTLIGRIESFGSDSKFILASANLSWILDGYDHESHVQEEIVTLINYNFELFAIKPYIIKCISKSGMFSRLWKSFQINGYLPASAVMSDLDNTATIEQFIQLVLDEYRKRPNTPDVWRKQRKEFMIDAYKTIPTTRMRDLRMKYARDFLLFNYDPKPTELFSYRH